MKQTASTDAARLALADAAALAVLRLRERGARLACAESCTGGLLGAALTGVSGASAVFEASVACYSNAAKTRLLGVPEALIEAHGAVSEPVVEALARGVVERLDVTVAVAVSGVAGPGGGTRAKPVGTTCIAWLDLESDILSTNTLRFDGDREQVRIAAACAALTGIGRMADQAGGALRATAVLSGHAASRAPSAS